MTEHEYQRYIQRPSETEEIRISVCYNRQNQFYKSNPNQGLQTMGIQPPVKGGRPSYPPKGDIKKVKMELSVQEEMCETITRDTSYLVSKAKNQISQDNQQ